MNLLRKIQFHLRSLFQKRKLDEQLSEEIQAHVQLATEDNVAKGMNLEEARYAALREFGNLANFQECARESRGWIWLEQAGQDLRYAVRQLQKSPGFAATAILTIAIGIGACTALFSLVNGVLLRPLSFPESHRIVIISETRPSNGTTPVAPAAYLDWARQNSVFEHLAVLGRRSYNSVADSKGIKINAQDVTANYFAVFGIQPLLGRGFLPEEEIEGSNRVVVVGFRFWQNTLGGRTNVLGETLLLDDQPYTIVGVTPDMDFIWSPAVFTPKSFSTSDRSDYGSHNLFCLGRLKSGVSVEAAQSEMDLISAGIARAHPATNLDRGARVTVLLSDLTGDVRQQLFILLGAVGFILLIAGVNVASLLLARAGARVKEIALRAALGASGGRIVRQFLCESMLISAIGGLLGTALAYSGMGVLVKFSAKYVPRTEHVHLDGTALFLAIGLMILTGIGVGLVPAVQSARTEVTEAIKDGGKGLSVGRKRQRVRSGLVIVEIALALMLLTGAGLLARSLIKLQSVDQGFSSENVLITQFELGAGKKYDEPGKLAAFARQAIERVSAHADVHSVAITSGQPMIGFNGLLFAVAGAPELPLTAMPVTCDSSITPDYFKAMNIPLIKGRAFNDKDVAGAPRVVIINEALAHKYFPDTDPIGQRLMIMTMADKPDVLREIVGVVGNVKPYGPQSDTLVQVYEPFEQRSKSTLAMIVRTRSASGVLPAAVTAMIHDIDPHLPFPNLQSFDLKVANAWSRQQFSLIVFLIFSGIALVLAGIGVYGVIAYSVEQRTQEIGIRMALGAQAGDVLKLVITHGLGIVVIGLVAGGVGSLAFGHILQSLLFDTSAMDVVTLLSVALLLAIIAMLACWLPAKRATKVDPLVALRME